MRNTVTVAVLLAIVLPQIAGPIGSTGLERTASAAGPPKAFLLEVGDVRAKSGRVPRGFGQLGLSKDQKERVYGIQAAYANRIAELEEEIEQLKKEQLVRIKGVLNDAQRLQIERYELAAAAKKGNGGDGE